MQEKFVFYRKILVYFKYFGTPLFASEQGILRKRRGCGLSFAGFFFQPGGLPV